MNLLNYIVWNPNPIIGHIGPVTLRWYSMCWLVGLILGYLLMKKLYQQQHIPEEKFDPLIIYIFVGVLVGARLGHCLFYQPDYFLTSWDHIIEMILPIRHMPDGGWKLTGYEGLASHGGVIGMFIGIYLYCRRNHVGWWIVLDNMGICSGITAMFIRLGNLMNSEIIGRVTDVPWAFIFVQDDNYPRHPGQLYEAIAYGIIFLIIYTFYRKKGPKTIGSGFYFGLCLALIFTFRFLIEYTKEIQEPFEAGLPLDMGQVLSIPLVAIGIWSICTSKKRNAKLSINEERKMSQEKETSSIDKKKSNRK
ncbi:MAG: prolipoprotein diacylglyceryl transferase [Prevotella sp.]|nr:prolipoprotein diacylglyceryl transferase [Prevotella sp.]MCH4182227.1 prolipoprotein diacylglyceryl transferase [Prevotella sp.]MCH4211192.1 prolipoprotein diacylglyceryl transferase [Prevotella sp.]MCH4241192.1 prolipoprotein diacylglyceryl transferase [Prevotella sp.]